MESLKEEALFVAMENLKGNAKKLKALDEPTYEVRKLNLGKPFFEFKKKTVELPRIDEKIVEEVKISNESIAKEEIFVEPPKPKVQKTKKPTSKSKKRKYDIDLIS